MGSVSVIVFTTGFDFQKPTSGCQIKQITSERNESSKKKDKSFPLILLNVYLYREIHPYDVTVGVCLRVFARPESII